jgi:hypothetical protein
MNEPPTAENRLHEIRVAAYRFAESYRLMYGKPRTRREWDAGSQEDFWSSAQDDLGILRAQWIDLPEDEMEHDL